MNFLTFSDIHIHSWKNHNEGNWRTEAQVKVILSLVKQAKPDAIFIPGDFCQSPDQLSRASLSHLISLFNRLIDIPIYIISGNHDYSESTYRDGYQTISWAYILSLIYSNVSLVDFQLKLVGKINGKKVLVAGIPYLNTYQKFQAAVQDMLEATKDHRESGNTVILMIHQDLPGAVDTNGFRGTDAFEDDNIYTLLNQFDFVLCGHIHKPQRLSKKVLMVGAPYQQRASDSGGTFGGWMFNPNNPDLYRFLDQSDLQITPKFIYVDSLEEADIIERPLIKIFNPPEKAQYGIGPDLSNGENAIWDIIGEYVGSIKSVTRKKALRTVIKKAHDNI